MPFKSEKQRRYLFAKHPEIAKRWAKKYPTKDLPMYADNDDKEKRAVLGVLGRMFKNNLHPGLNFTVAQGLGQYLKKADSKLEHIQMPQHEKPTYSGEKPINSILKPETEDEGSVGDVMAQESQFGGAKELLRKIALVAAPEVAREAERRKAQQTGQTAPYVPDNVNVKQYPVSPTTPPPMNLNAPAPAQPAAPQQPPAPNPNTTPAVGGGASPNARPIDAFGGMSATGDLTGNSAQGVQHAVGAEKQSNDDILSEIMSIDGSLDPTEQLELDEIWLDNLRAKCASALKQQKCSCGCGQKVAECTCAKSCSCRQKGGSCYGLKKEAGSKPGLWANIHAKRKRGEKPAKPGDKDYPEAKSWNKTVKKAYGIGEDFGMYERYMDGGHVYGEKPENIIRDIKRQMAEAKANNVRLSYSPHRYHVDPETLETSEYSPEEAIKFLSENLTKKPNEIDYARSPNYYAMTRDRDETGKYEPIDWKNWKHVASVINKKASSPAWQRSAGKNEAGGLNEKGRKSYEREHGGNLQAPVTEKNPTGKAEKRQNSFCSRMCGMKRVNTGAKTKSDPDSRINKSLRKWNCKCGSALEFGVTLGQALRGA